jgi:Fe-S-cluster containining protein
MEMTDEKDESSNSKPEDDVIEARSENISDKDVNDKKDDKNIQEEKNKTAPDRPPKFKFECQRTGDCCKREKVPISFSDIQHWVSDQTIFRVAPYINIAVENDEFQLQLAKDDDGYCKLYHRDNKACTIHFNKPLYCKSYPLGYNGENYIVQSKECTGLGKGKMGKDQLKEMRDDAREDYEGLRQTSKVLPVIQGIFYRQMMEESQKFMENLTPEDKKKMEDMMKGQRTED